MSFKATLNLEDKQINILYCEISFSRETNKDFYPVTFPQSGFVNIFIEADKDNFFESWAISPTQKKSGSIIFYKRDNMTKMKELSFHDAYCVFFKEHFTSTDTNPLSVQIQISAGELRYGDSVYKNPWFEEGSSNNHSAESTTKILKPHAIEETPVVVSSSGEKVEAIPITANENNGVKYINGKGPSDITDIPKPNRPKPAEYLDADYMKAHLSQFEEGASYVVPKESLDKRGREIIGRPDGQFVMPKNQLDSLLEKANGDLNIIETELGIPPGMWKGKELARIDIPDTKKHDVRIPDGNEAGANELWIPGGKLPNGILETVINQPKKGDYTETPIKIKNN